MLCAAKVSFESLSSPRALLAVHANSTATPFAQAVVPLGTNAPLRRKVGRQQVVNHDRVSRATTYQPQFVLNVPRLIITSVCGTLPSGIHGTTHLRDWVSSELTHHFGIAFSNAVQHLQAITSVRSVAGGLNIDLSNRDQLHASLVTQHFPLLVPAHLR